ncbi:MAG: EF-hand domain-containing protein [Gammaproteobacteria bacterium]|nr:EF-hand domain-containing protein [Gammaproteobacteria bacterium]
MTTEIDPEELEELRLGFELADKNGDGHINQEEFFAFTLDLIGEATQEENAIGFAEADAYHNGVINFEEFINWWRSTISD